MKRGNTPDRSDASSKRGREMEMSPPSTSTPTTDATTFLDLNDDCLYKMYEHLDLPTLCSVADACIRLRRTAQDHFARSNVKKFNIVAHMKLVYPRSQHNGIPVEQVLLKASYVLRIFGTFITSFVDINGMNQRRQWDAKSQLKYRSKIVKLLAKYCKNGNLTELNFQDENLTEVQAVRLRPLLKGLQILYLAACSWSAHLVQMLPAWCPDLRALYITGSCFNFLLDDLSQKLDGLRQRFPKLTRASFVYIPLDCAEIEYFLKYNPQLREFKVINCIGPDPSIFEYIGKYATEIQTLRIDIQGLGPGQIARGYPPNARCFDRLRNLKSITLNFNGTYIVQAIRDIVAAGIPLKMLSVGTYIWNERTLFSKVKELKTLEILSWRLRGIMHSNGIIKICEHLTELSELEVSIGAEVTAENLLELVRAAGKLQWLSIRPTHEGYNYNNKLVIDGDAYKSLVEVVENRPEKTHLEIELERRVYRLDIPQELAAIHKGSVTMVLIPKRK